MNTIVAVPFDERIAEHIGKKGSENSITFYNRKIDGNAVVVLMPSSLEEKFYALPQSLLMADQIIVSTRDIDKLFGEVLIACSLLEKRVIFTKDNDISKLITGISFKDVAFADYDNIFVALMPFMREESKGKQTRIDIDKAFGVKGVGTVALGIVTRGTLSVHDTLYHNSSKSIVVRSIQSLDEDIKEATTGTRVGVALKGIDDKDIKKGDVLSSIEIKPAKLLEISMKMSSFVIEALECGKSYGIAIGFTYTTATVESISDSKISIKLERAVPVEIGDTVMFVRTIAPRIFASGKVENAK